MPRRQIRSPEGQVFGEALRQLRGDRGLSQEALAERADIAADLPRLHRARRERRELMVMLRLAKALDVQPSPLLRPFDKRAN